MSQARMFSRLQLAAALIEYDNDPENANAENRDAKQSALFTHLRPGFVLRPKTHAPRKSGDHLGVSLPSDGDVASMSGRTSALDGRRSRGSRTSIDMLRNPFSGDLSVEGEDEDEEILEEPDLDFSKWGLEAYMANKDAAPPSSKRRTVSQSLQSPFPEEANARRKLRSRSVGEYDKLTEPPPSRRRSFGSPLDVADKTYVPFDSLRDAAYGPSDFPSSVPVSVPFPTSGVSDRSFSPLPTNDQRERVISSASKGSRVLLDDQPRHSRALSNATLGTIFIDEDNPFALRPPSAASRFDPKAAAFAAHRRAESAASLGRPPSSMSIGTSMRARKPSNMELLRPKVLIMPSPLQSAPVPPVSNRAQPPLSQGFHASTDGPPLPAGAKSARPLSTTLEGLLQPPIASNSFTPNPRISLSLSQLTFRNTLAVDGQRDSEFIDLGLPSTAAEGEQAYPIGEERDPTLLETDPQGSRPAGKLYGKSLIDDLQSRKQDMRKKQRVFGGDQRPSMMNRGAARRSTLIDPATLPNRPVSQQLNSFGAPGATLERRQSQLKPLLNFDSDENLAAPNPAGTRQPSAIRSVFGPDKLWEREMEKLKLIEAEEMKERQIAESNDLLKVKKGKKGKNKNSILQENNQPNISPTSVSPISHIPDAPPTLPVFESTLARQAPQADDSDSDDEPLPRPSDVSRRQRWSSSSSDERVDVQAPRLPSLPNPIRNDSDEDLPLAISMDRARHQAASHNLDDSDEELPLSTLLMHKQSRSNVRDDDDDDDDKPLGLRAPGGISSAIGGGDEDDRPLALHPEQQRRSQYNMLMTQHQNMVYAQQQAQMQSAMFLNPPAMPMSGYFPPNFMQPQMMPPLHDASKLNTIDKWRKNVVVEGSEYKV